MVPIAWAALGLLAATLLALMAALFQLGSRIEAQGRDLGARLDALGQELRGALDTQTARIDALSARMDAHLGRHPG